MKNLRITPKREFVDSYNTGDSQSNFKYEVRRDWEQEKDGYKNIETAESVKEAGVVIETFNSEDNAKIFIASFELLHSLQILNIAIEDFYKRGGVVSMPSQIELSYLNGINAIKKATE